MYNTNSEGDSSKHNTGRHTFQLPSLPPWKTPQYRKLKESGSSTLSTPLNRVDKKITRKGYNLESDMNNELGIEIDGSNQEHQSQKNRRYINSSGFGISNNSEANSTEYDFQTFSLKFQLQETKKNNILRSERAAHCLVFHKSAHNYNKNEYRPDLYFDCGENLDKSSNLLHMKSSQETYDESNALLLESLPGYTNSEIKKGSIKKLSLERPNVRRIEEILNHETNALNKFWDNSQLTESFERNQLHEHYLILKQEQEELKKIKEDITKKMNPTQESWLRKIVSQK
ncbi:hypothetical protein TPHA_0C01030 [Tetrapisispora phaffii CBS 4417]|uniref:Uncharacterized protein n=1 Tax=Tetrapisispora phaffii (strain ATCC 24235 / CBS 4417 / NBRC 1672 / NRRL Y-8282 / UCD 70-5) TaxID=1071381 RepID=G8BR83_TETPH|nr:hypothetical protein TPHA_0C01030 [Tetrapisispora phaffii CBS 4417]CCE62259.1 hypothetical protein TPHA_0C01030 [Tetrapisispora phaffii CBS 4417]